MILSRFFFGGIVFLSLNAFSIFPSYSQDWNQVDILQMKNGKYMYGKIIKHIPNQEIHLISTDSSLYIIPTVQISVIRNGPYEYKKPAYQLEKPKVFKKYISPTDSAELAEVYKTSGFTILLKGNYILLNSYSGNFVIGRQLNPYLNLGIGSGLEKYTQFGNTFLRLNREGVNTTQYQEDYFLPIVGSIRVFTSKRRMAFTANIEAGYSIYLPNMGVKSSNGTLVSDNLYRKVQGGGFVGNISIGARTFISPKIAVIYEAGVKFQSYSAREVRLTNPTASKGSFASNTNFLSNNTIWNLTPFLSIGLLF